MGTKNYLVWFMLFGLAISLVLFFIGSDPDEIDAGDEFDTMNRNGMKPFALEYTVDLATESDKRNEQTTAGRNAGGYRSDSILMAPSRNSKIEKKLQLRFKTGTSEKLKEFITNDLRRRFTKVVFRSAVLKNQKMSSDGQIITHRMKHRTYPFSIYRKRKLLSQLIVDGSDKYLWVSKELVDIYQLQLEAYGDNGIFDKLLESEKRLNNMSNWSIDEFFSLTVIVSPNKEEAISHFRDNFSMMKNSFKKYTSLPPSILNIVPMEALGDSASRFFPRSIKGKLVARMNAYSELSGVSSRYLVYDNEKWKLLRVDYGI